VPKKKSSDSSLPPEVIEHWPEVFEDLDVKVVPLEYLHSVRVFFQDGKIWDIDIAKSKEKNLENNLEDTLEELFTQYDDVITNVDFRLDTKRLKDDITKRTRSFLKKRK
jgi:hypothetical protein|tara:strand:- start:1615 stop:1941 length:327 start_codon:yes stop_codon:yes gene_type:complete